MESTADRRSGLQFEVERAHQRQKTSADSSRRPHEFKVGDLVKLKTSHLKPVGHNCRKLKDYFAGPFRIVGSKSPVSFELDLPATLSKKFPAFHVDQLQPYFISDELRFQPEPQPVLTPDDDEFIADRILDVDFDAQRTTLMFKVRWAPPYQDPSEDSWLPLKNVSDLAALDDFLRTSTWTTFAATRSFSSFRRRFPDRVPDIAP